MDPPSSPPPYFKVTAPHPMTPKHGLTILTKKSAKFTSNQNIDPFLDNPQPLFMTQAELRSRLASLPKPWADPTPPIYTLSGKRVRLPQPFPAHEQDPSSRAYNPDYLKPMPDPAPLIHSELVLLGLAASAHAEKYLQPAKTALMSPKALLPELKIEGLSLRTERVALKKLFDLITRLANFNTQVDRTTAAFHTEWHSIIKQATNALTFRILSKEKNEATPCPEIEELARTVKEEFIHVWETLMIEKIDKTLTRYFQVQVQGVLGMVVSREDD